MTALGAHSEVGRLREVIVHRPDLSLRRLTPDNCKALLFDDVLWVKRALLHETNWWRIPIFDAGLCGFNFDADGFRAWCLQHAVTDAASKFNFSLLVGEFA